MICVTLKEYNRACGSVSGGMSDITVFDPNDLNFVQAAKVAGVAQPYTAITFRPGAVTSPTAATSTITLTDVGDDADTIAIAINGITIVTVTKTSAESTVTLLAAKVVAAINATASGYTAANSSGVITITAPTTQGDALNGENATVTVVGTITFTQTAFSGGADGTNRAKVYNIKFTIDEAEWTWKQSVKGCSTKYDHEFKFQLPDNSHLLTTFLEALDAAACCCGLAGFIRLNSGKIFVFGEKYVNNTSIPRFTVKHDGSDGGSGKLYDDLNGGNIVLKGSYLRNLYEYTGSWEDVEALM